MANMRSGRSKGYPGQKGGAHQVAWQKDKLILDRIAETAKEWAKGRSFQEINDRVNKWLVATYPKEEAVSVSTSRRDVDHYLELRKEDSNTAVDRHLAEYSALQEKALDAFDETDKSSLNRGSLLATAAQIIERKSKIDGSLSPDQRIEVVVKQQGERLMAVFESALNDQEWGLDMPSKELGKKAIAKAVRAMREG